MSTDRAQVSATTNSQFITNSTGLGYEVLEVHMKKWGIIRPALQYIGNILEDCAITSVQLDVS